jgi:hypothetical protein
MAKAPSKQDIITSVLVESEQEIARCHTAMQLANAGKKGFRGLAPIEGSEEAFATLDKLLNERAQQINLAGPDAPFQIRFHHGYFLAPTPVIGTQVYVWFPRDKQPRFGFVTAISEMGKVQVHMVYGSAEQARPPFVPALHVTHPLLEADQMLCKWDYMPGVEPDRIDFDFGLNQIANRERNARNTNADNQAASRKQNQLSKQATKETGEPVSV